MKKVDTILKDYVAKLTPDNLKFLSVRFNDRISGDLGEALDMLSASHDVDKWLKTAKSSDDFFDMLDKVKEYVDREINKRSPELHQGAA